MDHKYRYQWRGHTRLVAPLLGFIIVVTSGTSGHCLYLPNLGTIFAHCITLYKRKAKHKCTSVGNICGVDVHERKGDERDSSFQHAHEFWFCHTAVIQSTYGTILSHFYYVMSISCHIFHTNAKSMPIYCCVSSTFYERGAPMTNLDLCPGQFNNSGIQFGSYTSESLFWTANECMCTEVLRDTVITRIPFPFSLSSNSSTSGLHWFETSLHVVAT